MVSALSSTKSFTGYTKSDEDEKTTVSESSTSKVAKHPSPSTLSSDVVVAPAVTISQPLESLPSSRSEDKINDSTEADNKVNEAKTKDEYNEKLMPRRSVSFDTIQFREFALALGDNPSTTHGPPLTLDWNYEDVEPVKVDEYEKTRPPRRITQQMMIPGNIREIILLSQTETTKKEISRMVSQVRSSRQQRRVTLAMQDFEEWHEALEFVSRRFRRFRKRITKEREQELLWENAAHLLQKGKLEEARNTNNNDLPQEDAVSDDTIDDECVGCAE